MRVPDKWPTDRDYTLPIAREGEQQYAAIIRNRSGIDAGEIDYAYRSPPKDTCYEEKVEFATAALMLYEAIVRDLGVHGSRAVIDRVKEVWDQAKIEKGE